MKYIYQNPDWHNFRYDKEKIQNLLLEIKKAQGFLLGKMETLGFEVQNSANLKLQTENIIKSHEIEGEMLPISEVRSSIAGRLGIDIAGEVHSSERVNGVVEMMLDAVCNYDAPLTSQRLIGWHAALFPTGYSGMHKITVGSYRDDSLGVMQVVSGSIGREKVHYEAPPACVLAKETEDLLDYVNNDASDELIKAGIAHLWFVILHPFDDGNGRIARTITDMLLAKSDNSPLRFYSMSAQIQKKRKGYYEILERTQKGSMDITQWLVWFLENLLIAINSSEEILSDVIFRAKFWQKNSGIVFSLRQKKVLNRFLDNFKGNLTTAKWAKICNCSQDTATNDINDLIKKNILKKVGEGRSVHYILGEKCNNS